MTINVDFSTALTVDELSAKVSDLSNSLNAETAVLEQSTKDLVDSSIMNCGVFGSMQGLVKDAAKGLTDTVTDLTGSVQKTITELMKSVSELVKSMKERFASALAALTSKIASLTDSMTALIDQIKLKAAELISKLNDMTSALKSTLTDIMSGIKDIFSDFADGLKKMFAFNCNTVSTALKDMPTGAGAKVDALIDAAKQPADNLLNTAMDGVNTQLGTFASKATDFTDSISGVGSNMSSLDTIISDIGNV